MNFFPRAVKEIDPRSVLPFADFGVRYVHFAEPRAAFFVPVSFLEPIVALQASPVGRMGAPFAVTRTVAETTPPALGLAGDTRAAPAETVTVPPPPVLGRTTTVTDAELFVSTGSTVDAP